jgi:hypothetical protein
VATPDGLQGVNPDRTYLQRPGISSRWQNLARGGRLERAKPTSLLEKLCRAPAGLACAPAEKPRRGKASSQVSGKEGEIPREGKRNPKGGTGMKQGRQVPGGSKP